MAWDSCKHLRIAWNEGSKVDTSLHGGIPGEWLQAQDSDIKVTKAGGEVQG